MKNLPPNFTIIRKHNQQSTRKWIWHQACRFCFIWLYSWCCSAVLGWTDKKRNWCEMVCGRPVTVALFLMYHSVFPVEGAQIERRSAEISISRRLGFWSHLLRWSCECAAYLVTLCVSWPAKFDLCFQGHDPQLISFQAAILTAGLSFYDTPG